MGERSLDWLFLCCELRSGPADSSGRARAHLASLRWSGCGGWAGMAARGPRVAWLGSVPRRRRGRRLGWGMRRRPGDVGMLYATGVRRGIERDLIIEGVARTRQG